MDLDPRARSASARAGPPLRVMIVDDSAVCRALFSRWIEQERDLLLAGVHRNGRQAVNDIAASKPDVVILDIDMPVMDGLEALPLLLKARASAKVIIASTLTRRNATLGVRALSLGAFDYLAKPDAAAGAGEIAFHKALIGKILALNGRSGPKSSPRYRSDAGALKGPANQLTGVRGLAPLRPRIIAIGSSTGGPHALHVLCRSLESVLDRVPVVITQHLPPVFISALAEQLGRTTGRTAKPARDGEPLRDGVIYIAPGAHMVVARTGGQPVIALNDGPEINFCKPSVDPMLSSAADVFGRSALAIVLTGMGRDGASGALRVANAGGNVIAQDEASSVVWGMPGATYASGACSAVMALDDIGPAVVSLFAARRP